MQILNIEPKDIHVTIDLSITEITGLLRAGEKVKIDYDGKSDPDMIKAVGFFKSFFKLLLEIEEQVGPIKRNAT